MLPALPALTKFYGLTPMDVEQMTLREVNHYVLEMQAAIRAQQVPQEGAPWPDAR